MSRNLQSLLSGDKTEGQRNTAPKLLDAWSLIANSQKFFRLQSSHNILPNLCVRKDHVRKCLHHVAVFEDSKSTYVIRIFREIAYVIYFIFTDPEIDSYVSELEGVILAKSLFYVQRHICGAKYPCITMRVRVPH